MPFADLPKLVLRFPRKNRRTAANFAALPSTCYDRRMSALERRHKEHLLHHRGLLLFAMQHPDNRSLRAVARATGKSESTARGWQRRNDWGERAKGPTAEEEAIALYRRLYLKLHGAVELPEVADRVVVPMSAQIGQEPPSSEVAEDIRQSDQIVSREINRRKVNDEKARDQHVSLVDGALGYVVGEMKAGRIRASLRDIPSLLQAREILTGGNRAGEGVAPSETVRVRTTRQAGGDVLEAMWEDIEEMRVVIGALRTREVVAAQTAKPGLVALDGGAGEAS